MVKVVQAKDMFEIEKNVLETIETTQATNGIICLDIIYLVGFPKLIQCGNHQNKYYIA